jgi:D-arabinose 1-dehydrogenase-like Zn-dependent alcohol dehydrogenase
VGSDATARSGLDALGFGGLYLAVGVGGSLSAPLLDIVGGEKRVEGVYVGTYAELVELTALALDGRVAPHVVTYPLDAAERALRDLASGAFVGRAVLVP